MIILFRLWAAGPIFFLQFILITTANAQFSNLKFENYSMEEGLSSSTCLEVFQSSDGYMWFGTIDGLNKYDGHSFQTYRPIQADSTSISGNRVFCIAEDANGNLWIGTNNGLNVLLKGLNKFKLVDLSIYDERSRGRKEVINDLVFHEPTNTLWVASNSGMRMVELIHSTNEDDAKFDLDIIEKSVERIVGLENQDIYNIEVDADWNIWVTTRNSRIYKYRSTGIRIGDHPINDTSDDQLDYLPKSLLVDDEGKVWVGNNLSSLLYLDLNETMSKVHITRDISPIYDLYQDEQQRIWVATSGDGIYILDKGGKVLEHLEHENMNPFSLPNNLISKVYQDRNGIFWIGTYDEGVVKLDMDNSLFGHFFYQGGYSQGLSSKNAQSVLQDSHGRIWVGTGNGGLNLLDEATAEFTYYNHDPKNSNSLSSDKILYLSESSDNALWVCTLDGGLNKFFPKNGNVLRYQHDSSNPNSLGQNLVWCAIEDNKKRVWIGTQKAGLNLLNQDNGQFQRFLSPNDGTGLQSNFIFSLFIDSKNRLFIGTSEGVCWIELSDLGHEVSEDLSIHQVHDPYITGSRVNYISEDGDKNIWVGSDLGLHVLNEDLSLIRSYSVRDGLPSNFVLGIKELDSFIWVTTRGGLACFDKRVERFTTFNANSGVQGIEFHSKSIDLTNDGRLIAGGINGFNLFDPAKILHDTSHVTPMITGLILHNRNIEVGDEVNGRVLLERPLTELDHIELRHDEGYIALKFVALHFKHPKGVHYAFKMHGIDKDFTYTSLNQTANIYSGLSNGKYQFEIKASLDKNWEKAQSVILNITVLPPIWLTWWAQCIYFFVGVLILWLVLKYYTKALRDQRTHEIDQMKLLFFINVSHEFRTPLTLILYPVEKILSSFNENSEEVNKSALTIQRSARRLLNLVNQLLDSRRVDLGKSPMNLEYLDIVAFCRDILIEFEELAKAKQIELRFACSMETYNFNFDPEKLEKVIVNLLSNAIKFTGSCGVVNLTLSEICLSGINNSLQKITSSTGIRITVEDTGQGIKADHLEHIFDRFYNTDYSHTGTGIGLHYAKSLVQQHGGEIKVESTAGVGSKFIIQLPRNETVIAKSEQASAAARRALDVNEKGALEYGINVSSDIQSNNEDEKINKSVVRNETILIVEDNQELRKLLSEELGNYYKIKMASNGKEGLVKAQKFFPDLIISDVMMPEMNGFEMCDKIKSDLGTCHIPVILLTARSLDMDQIEGYRLGADAYLPKPFNSEVLKTRVANLLRARKTLKDKYRSEKTTLFPKEVTTNTLDERFLEKATQAVVDNISDADFDLAELSREVGLSRSHFFRKIHTLTNLNPSKFVRSVRLKYASELLKQNPPSIKEVVYKSGFNSSAYFSKCFREDYGYTPNEFIAKHSENKSA